MSANRSKLHLALCTALAATLAATASVHAQPMSLGLENDLDLTGFVFSSGSPLLHTAGGPSLGNTALGSRALASVTPQQPLSIHGRRNTAVGERALFANTSGSANTAIGNSALATLEDGARNTAVGNTASVSVVSNSNTTAVGQAAMFFAAGDGNTAVGYQALLQSTGRDNIGLGRSAGTTLTNGDLNIMIGNEGVSTDDKVIRIGSASSSATYIAGIRGAASAGGLQVLANSNHQLGTSTSSRRFKENIRDMGDASSRLLGLRPVTFRYRRAMGAAAPGRLEYGLVAEEVAESFPELVVHDSDGKVLSVRYDLLAPLMLNEFQELRRRSRDLDRRIESLGHSLMESEGTHP